MLKESRVDQWYRAGRAVLARVEERGETAEEAAEALYPEFGPLTAAQLEDAYHGKLCPFGDDEGEPGDVAGLWVELAKVRGELASASVALGLARSAAEAARSEADALRVQVAEWRTAAEIERVNGERAREFMTRERVHRARVAAGLTLAAPAAWREEDSIEEWFALHRLAGLGDDDLSRDAYRELVSIRVQRAAERSLVVPSLMAERDEACARVDALRRAALERRGE